MGRPATQAEPAWGRVLVSTVKLAVSRRLRTAGPGRPPGGGARRRWRLATLVLALAGAAVTVLWLTGGLSGAPSRAARLLVRRWDGLADGAAGRQLFRRLYQMSTALMDSLVRAGLADPGADPGTRVAVLWPTTWPCCCFGSTWQTCSASTRYPGRAWPARPASSP